MAEHNDLGKWGEDEAALYLEDEGYTIIDRDWRLGRRDLDILAYTPDGNTLVVVEVKTRTGEEYQQPEEAVTPRQDEESCHSCQCLCQGMPGGQRVALRCHLHRGKRTSGEESAASQGCLQSDADTLDSMLVLKSFCPFRACGTYMRNLNYI